VAQIELDKECGEDNVCEPELSVDWQTVSGVVLGCSQSHDAQVRAGLRVRNTGETAYEVSLNVTLPRPTLQFAAATPEHSVCRAATVSMLVSWSLTSLFSTNMAISETNGHSL